MTEPTGPDLSTGPSTGPTAEPADTEPADTEGRGVRRVPVEGGFVAVRDLNPGAAADAPLVLLVHGITANGAAWSVVGAELARRHGERVRVWAPDLRGRAMSRGTTRPAGIDAHVADLAAVLDAARGEAGDARAAADTADTGDAHGEAGEVDDRCVLVGHSMGGFVTALAAATYPSRLRGAVLVDGGFAFPAPAGLDIDAALTAVIGPAMQRLSMRFPTPAAYLDFWAAHPAVGPLLRGAHAGAVRTYLLSDLVPTAQGDYVSSCVADVIRADGRAILADPEVLGAGRRALAEGVPLRFVWAERGLLDEAVGLYDADRIAALALPEAVEVTGAEGVNHYGVILDDAAVTVVVDAIDAALVG